MDYPTVNIEGEEYPFLLGRGALRLYARKKGFMETKTKDLDSMIMDATMDDQDMISWFAFKVACSATGKKFKYDFEEFQKVLDENPHVIDAIDDLQAEQTPDIEGTEKNMKAVRN